MGSEMCIRDRMRKTLGEAMLKSREKNGPMGGMGDGLGDL